MPTLPPLYKRTKTAAIQYWMIEVTQQEDYGVITKTSGQYGTDKPIENVEFVTEGRNLNKSNATTPIQQAELQATSDWKKKQDQGYKTLETLGITNDEGVGAWSYNGAHYAKLVDALEAALPTYNTDASGNVRPMLALPVKWHKVTYPCAVSPKLDGCRSLLVFNGKDVTFLSRTGKTYTTLGHIREEVVANFKEPVILDGEVYAHNLTFQEITAAIKKQRDDSLKLCFKAYDIVSEENQLHRLRLLSDLLDPLNLSTIHRLESMECHTKDAVMELHNHWVGVGYEGAMIRLHDGRYEQGQRSSYLLKVKEYDSNEFSFVEFLLGQRGVEDLIARCYTDDGGEFKAKMQGTVAQKQELYSNHPPAGSPLTVKHFGYTDDNLPRFPIGISFRDYE
jgi:DNA ligase 1